MESLVSQKSGQRRVFSGTGGGRRAGHESHSGSGAVLLREGGLGSPGPRSRTAGKNPGAAARPGLCAAPRPPGGLSTRHTRARLAGGGPRAAGPPPCAGPGRKRCAPSGRRASGPWGPAAPWALMSVAPTSPPTQAAGRGPERPRRFSPERVAGRLCFKDADGIPRSAAEAARPGARRRGPSRQLPMRVAPSRAPRWAHVLREVCPLPGWGPGGGCRVEHLRVSRFKQPGRAPPRGHRATAHVPLPV